MKALTLLLVSCLLFSSARSAADELHPEHTSNAAGAAAESATPLADDGTYFSLETDAADPDSEVDVPGTVWMWVKYGAAVVATIALGVVAESELSDIDLGDDNSSPGKIDKAEAEKQAAAAAAVAFEQGRQDALANPTATVYEDYIVLSGTFTVSKDEAVTTATGLWTPSITFGGVSADFTGGPVSQVSMPPRVEGEAPQSVGGGRWVRIDKDLVSVQQVPSVYEGTATIEGGTFILQGRRYSGGSIARIQRAVSQVEQ